MKATNNLDMKAPAVTNKDASATKDVASQTTSVKSLKAVFVFSLENATQLPMEYEPIFEITIPNDEKTDYTFEKMAEHIVKALNETIKNISAKQDEIEMFCLSQTSDPVNDQQKKRFPRDNKSTFKISPYTSLSFRANNRLTNAICQSVSDTKDIDQWDIITFTHWAKDTNLSAGSHELAIHLLSQHRLNKKKLSGETLLRAICLAYFKKNPDFLLGIVNSFNIDNIKGFVILCIAFLEEAITRSKRGNSNNTMKMINEIAGQQMTSLQFTPALFSNATQSPRIDLKDTQKKEIIATGITEGIVTAKKVIKEVEAIAERMAKTVIEAAEKAANATADAKSYEESCAARAVVTEDIANEAIKAAKAAITETIFEGKPSELAAILEDAHTATAAIIDATTKAAASITKKVLSEEAVKAIASAAISSALAIESKIVGEEFADAVTKSIVEAAANTIEKGVKAVVTLSKQQFELTTKTDAARLAREVIAAEHKVADAKKAFDIAQKNAEKIFEYGIEFISSAVSEEKAAKIAETAEDLTVIAFRQEVEARNKLQKAYKAAEKAKHDAFVAENNIVKQAEITEATRVAAEAAAKAAIQAAAEIVAKTSQKLPKPSTVKVAARPHIALPDEKSKSEGSSFTYRL